MIWLCISILHKLQALDTDWMWFVCFQWFSSSLMHTFYLLWLPDCKSSWIIRHRQKLRFFRAPPVEFLFVFLKSHKVWLSFANKFTPSPWPGLIDLCNHCIMPSTASSQSQRNINQFKYLNEDTNKYHRQCCNGIDLVEGTPSLVVLNFRVLVF